MSQGSVQLRILGPVELHDQQGSELPIGGPKQRAVLAALALHPDGVLSTERLARLLWGQDLPGSPRSSIQSYVSRLRGVADAVAITHFADGYLLTTDGIESDLHHFRRLTEGGGLCLEEGDPAAAAQRYTEALSLWRGRPLGGLGEMPLVSDFRPGLQELRLEATEQRFAAELAAGRDAELVAELQAVVAEHPFRERLRGQLMLGLYRAGRQAEALEVFRDTRALLMDELGVEPGEELAGLHRGLLEGRPPASHPARDVQRTPRRPGPAHPVEHPQLTGRERELTTLLRLLEATASGRSHAVLVGGEAGIGKTHLVDAVVARAAETGHRVLVGACNDMAASALPYAPFAGLLRSLADQDGVERLRQLLARPSGGVLAPLLPGLSVRGRSVDDLDEVRPRLFAAVLDLLVMLSHERPLLVVLEDLHWSDESTLDLLGFMVRNLRYEPVLFVATLRTDEVAGHRRLDDLLSELPRLAHATRLDLEPFTGEEVAEQVTDILGRDPDEDFLRRVVRRSGGNPFYVEELVAARGEGRELALTSTLRDTVRGRLKGLTQQADEVLAHAAAVGRPVGHDLIARSTGLEHDMLGRAARELLDRRLLVVDDTSYRFRHALVRDVVYDDALPGRRATLHRRIAEALAAEHGAIDDLAGELARHWHAAGEGEKALEASLRAAERARRAGAFPASLDHHERALDLWAEVWPTRDRASVLCAAAEVAGHAGRAERRVAHLREALRVMGPDVDPERGADVRSGLARALFDLGDDDAALRQAELASRLVEDRDASAVKARAMSNHASLLLTSVRADRRRAIAPARAAVDAARRAGDRLEEAHAQERLGSALSWTGALEEGMGHLRAALESAHDVGDPPAAMAAYFSLFFALHRLAGRFEDARDVADEALSWLDVLGDRWAGSAGLVACLSYADLQTGQWQRADDLLDRVALHHLEGGQAMSFHVVRGTLRWMQGRTDEAAADVARVRDARPGARLHQDLFPLAAEVAADSGELGDVRAIAREHLRFDVEPSEQPMKAATLRALVRAEVEAALASSGDPRAAHVARAREALDELRTLLRTFPPAPGGTFQHERPDTYLRLAEAELSRVLGPDPDAWHRIGANVAYSYWRTYAERRHEEAQLAAR